MERDVPLSDTQASSSSRTTEKMKVKGKDRGPVKPSSKLVLLPPSRHTTIDGIGVEEEDLYAELMRQEGQVGRSENASCLYSDRWNGFNLYRL